MLKVAIPSNQPGGLDASISAHFGHCDLYTIVTLSDNDIGTVDLLPNVEHESGGCMSPVKTLADHGVQALVAGGMGMRPLAGFHSVGIDVFFSNNAPTVGLAVSALVAGQLPKFSQTNVCQGSGNCGGH